MIGAGSHHPEQPYDEHVEGSYPPIMRNPEMIQAQNYPG